MPGPLYFGFAVASIGGPLALAALYVPSMVSEAPRSTGLMTLMASLLFVVPLLVWYRYSDRIASAGGLFAFVEAAAGPTVARIQGAFWIVSYALYLVYTIPYIVYDLLPIPFPRVSPYQPMLEVLVSVVIASMMLMPLNVSLSIVSVMALGQLIVVGTMAGTNLIHLGAPASSFTGHGNLPALLHGAANLSLLYICAGLPLFLGGEVKGGANTVKKGLVWAFGIVAALVILAVFPLANAGARPLGTTIPGVTLAGAFSGHAFAVVVGLGVGLSVAGLVIAEFVALSRLLATMFKRPSKTMVRWIAGAFVAANVASLINPQAVYADLLKPSLLCLWVSQLLVFAVYPRFVARHRRVLTGDVALTGAASALMLYGLYAVGSNLFST